MEDTELKYTIGEIDACRLIVVRYPPVIDLSRLSPTTADYLALWEEDVPTVQLNDVTNTEVLDEIRTNVLLSMLKRNSTRPNYWGTAYWVGENHAFAESLRGILLTAGRALDCIFETREESIAYLRAQIAAKAGDAES